MPTRNIASQSINTRSTVDTSAADRTSIPSPRARCSTRVRALHRATDTEASLCIDRRTTSPGVPSLVVAIAGLVSLHPAIALARQILAGFLALG